MNTTEDARQQGPVLEHYLAALRAGRLIYQSCNTCGQLIYYPRVACPHCASTGWTWQGSAGRGVLYAATHIPSREGPGRTVGIIDMHEGFRVMATWKANAGEDMGEIFEEVPAVPPPVGTPVKLDLTGLEGEEHPVVAFRTVT